MTGSYTFVVLLSLYASTKTFRLSCPPSLITLCVFAVSTPHCFFFSAALALMALGDTCLE